MKIGQIRKRLLTLQVTVVVLAIFVMIMGAAIVLQKEQMAEWQHLIDFLTMWVKQNGLTIVPTDSI